ncbi:hypothetical protein Bca101_088521 [Brassica carinata]
MTSQVEFNHWTTNTWIFMAEKRYEYRYATEDKLEEMKQREFSGWMFTYKTSEAPAKRTKNKKGEAMSTIDSRTGSREANDDLKRERWKGLTTFINLVKTGLNQLKRIPRSTHKEKSSSNHQPPTKVVKASIPDKLPHLSTYPIRRRESNRISHMAKSSTLFRCQN